MIKLGSMRVDSSSALFEDGGLDTWSFGQIVAVTFLATPLFALLARAIDGYDTERDLQAMDSTAEEDSSSPTNVARAEVAPQPLQDVEPGLLFSPHNSVCSQTPRNIHHRTTSCPTGGPLDTGRLLVQNKTTTFTWLSIYSTIAGLYWILLGGMAMLTTNPARWSSGSSYSLLEFWITGPGLVWWTIIWYPAIFGLSVAVGLHLEHYYLGSRGAGKIPRRILGFFTCLVLTQIVGGVLCPLVIKMVLVPSPLVALASSFGLYLLYGVICICLRLFHGYPIE